MEIDLKLTLFAERMQHFVENGICIRLSRLGRVEF